MSESVKLSLSFSYFSSPSWRDVSRQNTAFPPLKLIAKCYLFLAVSFLPFLIITKHFASKLKGLGSYTEDTESCSSVGGCFRWPAERRGEAEQLLGSCCKGPSSPRRSQPNLCSCTTLWIMCKPLRAVNRSHKLLRTTGQSGSSLQQADREAAERLHESTFSSRFAIAPGGQVKSEDGKQRHWEEVVESFSQGWCGVLDRALVEACT